MKAQEPKYITVINWVKEQISIGSLPMGGKLPSENELSEQFGLSRQTIRHAIDILEQEKLVTRIQGSGTYIGEDMKPGRQERHMNIAVISTYVDSYIFPPVLRGIERVLSGEGYTTQIAFTGNRINREREILSKLMEKGMIDGLIVEPAKSALPNPNLHFYRELIERQIPILFFNTYYPELKIPCVSLNDEQVGRDAVQYLIDAGHERIGGIFKCDDGQGHLRYAGYTRGLHEAGRKVNDRDVVWMDTRSEEDMELWADYLLSRISHCTALVCYNDEVAYKLAGLCRKKEIRIPEQLSLISIDNSELASLGDVKITSFPYPMEALGRKAAENMVKMIENPYFDGGYLFDSKVIERDSVRFIR